MSQISFEWDPIKAEINWVKHGISFDEAATVFSDAAAIIFDDPDHSQDEERLLIIGFSSYANLIVVCHCIRGTNEIIRIISARKATKSEKHQYTVISRGW